MDMENVSNLFGSKIGKTIRLIKELPLLLTATADNEEDTSGYVIEQIIELTHDTQKNEELVGWLNSRLTQNSLCVKLKVLRLFLQLVTRGSDKFRETLCKHPSQITSTTKLAGFSKDPQTSMIFASIRQTSKDVLKELYRESQDNDKDHSHKLNKTTYRGFGNQNKKTGFGNSLPPKNSLLQDIVEKLADFSSFAPTHQNHERPSFYSLKTDIISEAETTELLFLQNNNCENEESLIENFICSSDPFINRKTRTIFKRFDSLDRKKFILKLKLSLNEQKNETSVAACLFLLDAIILKNLYNIDDIEGLFHQSLSNIHSKHSNSSLSNTAKKILLRIKNLKDDLNKPVLPSENLLD